MMPPSALHLAMASQMIQGWGSHPCVRKMFVWALAAALDQGVDAEEWFREQERGAHP